MSEQNTLSLAKSGNPQAIARLINRVLQGGMSAEARRSGDRLLIFIEGDDPPLFLVNTIYRGLVDLDVTAVSTIEVYGRKLGETQSLWAYEMLLKEPAPPTRSVALTKPAKKPVPIAKRLRTLIQPLLTQTNRFLTSKAVTNRRLRMGVLIGLLVLLGLIGTLFGGQFLYGRFQQDQILVQVQNVSKGTDAAQAKSMDELNVQAGKLRQAIALLYKIPDYPGSRYKDAQAQAKTIRSQLQVIEQRIQTEAGVAQTWQTIQQTVADAKKLIQDPPHSVETWQQAQELFSQAIAQTRAIPDGTFVTAEAKQKLTEYKKSNDYLSDQLDAEQSASEALKDAQEVAKEAMNLSDSSYHDLADLQAAQKKWQSAIGLLKKVPSKSAASSGVGELQEIYSNNSKLVTEAVKKMQACLKKDPILKFSCGNFSIELISLPDSQSSQSGS